MNVSKIACPLMVTILAAFPVYAGKPALFGDLVLHGYLGTTCPKEVVSWVRSPDGDELSILFSNKFLDAGNAKTKISRATCRFDLTFSSALTQPETVYLDFRGSEFKDVHAAVEYTVALDHDRHRVEYRKGQEVDMHAAELLKRFALTDLPKGTKKIRVKLSGKAVGIPGKAAAMVDIDSIDACIVKKEMPGRCPEIPGAPQAADTATRK